MLFVRMHFLGGVMLVYMRSIVACGNVSLAPYVVLFFRVAFKNAGPNYSSLSPLYFGGYDI